jgi:hypothetical protein
MNVRRRLGLLIAAIGVIFCAVAKGTASPLLVALVGLAIFWSGVGLAFARRGRA